MGIAGKPSNGRLLTCLTRDDLLGLFAICLAHVGVSLPTRASRLHTIPLLRNFHRLATGDSGRASPRSERKQFGCSPLFACPL